MVHINYHEFDDIFKAWKNLNIYMAQNESFILKTPGAGGLQGSQLFAYNNFIRIKSHKSYREDWDIGAALGYAPQKWNSLVDNYVDMNYLDLVKHEVEAKKNSRSYNLSYHFKNKHGSGKDCLVALNFSKRVGIDYPIVVFTLRTSEITRRLIFDLVLVQRMIEYVYPDLSHVELHVQIPVLFLDTESFVLFNNTKSITKLMSKVPEPHGTFTRKVLTAFKKLSTVDPETITWKVHQRSAYFVQNKDHDKVGLYLKDFQLPKQNYGGELELFTKVKNRIKL